MSADQEGTPTPDKVKSLATQRAHLPRLALIGVFGSQTRPGALVRTPNGGILRVTLGDEVDGGRVAAIDTASIVIAHGTRGSVLKLPNS